MCRWKKKWRGGKRDVIAKKRNLVCRSKRLFEEYDDHQFTIRPHLSILHCAVGRGRSICSSHDRCFTQGDGNAHIVKSILRDKRDVYLKPEVVRGQVGDLGLGTPRRIMRKLENFLLNTSTTSCTFAAADGNEQKMAHKKSRLWRSAAGEEKTKTPKDPICPGNAARRSSGSVRSDMTHDCLCDH